MAVSLILIGSSTFDPAVLGVKSKVAFIQDNPKLVHLGT